MAGAIAIEQQTAEEAYLLVLKDAGATLPKRDSVDARIIDEVRNGTATYGNGITLLNFGKFERNLQANRF